MYTRLSISCYVLVIVATFPSEFLTCTYKGESYSDDPKKPVYGDTHYCYCDHGKWKNCQPIEKKPDEKDVWPATAIERRAHFKAADFVFDLHAAMPMPSGEGGEVRGVTAAELPSLKGQGVSYTLFKIKPCGINLPHVHPRATEILYVISAEWLQTVFTEENNGRTIVNDIKTGMVTFFPQGLIHYQQNLGCDEAVYISGLNNEDPGVLTVTTRLATIPSEGFQATFGLGEKEAEEFKRNLPSNPAAGHAECLKRCHIKPEYPGKDWGK